MNVISSCMEGIAISITYPFLSLLQSPDAIVNETKIINIIFGIFGVGFEFRSIVIFL